MLRFPELERAGARLACFTGCDDGDGAGEHGHDLARRILRDAELEHAPVRFLRQVHGARVVEAGEVSTNEQADGVVTNAPGTPLIIRVADCVPIYLVDASRKCGALLHAGWRGTLAGIAREGVRVLGEKYASRPEDLQAVIGPSAGPKRYEVSEELAARFSDAGLAVRGRLADLWESNAIHLREAEVPDGNIHISGVCTLADARFYSHRRNPAGGRNLAILVL